MQLNDAITSYENQLTKAIQEIDQNSILATIRQDDNNPIDISIGEVKTFQYGVTRHIGSININIGKKSIEIYTRIINYHDEEGFKLKISLLQNGRSIHSNTSKLINIDEEARNIRFKQISWTTRGQKFHQHKNFWYEKTISNNPLLQWDEDFFGKLKIIQNDREMSVWSEDRPRQITLNEEENPQEEIDNSQIIKDIAAVHAKSIIMRCVDWILYHAKITNASVDFADGENKCIKDAFPDIDFDPRQEQAQISRRISPYNLKAQCEANGLYYSDDVYQVISTSMNLGRHLILTGPPGCGKSRLAALVGEMINNKAPKIVTASPSWTSGEIVGRYFPRHSDGKLRFHPGVFLQASEENRCLVIDEMNRANLDECMGELFMVLAGQTVDLPYMDTIDDSEISSDQDNQEKERYGYIKIIPPGVASADYPENSVYRIDDGFRLIGTMNDSDRSALHNLSFALLRRFDVVKINSPENNLGNIIKNTIQTIINNNVAFFPSFNGGANAQETITDQISIIAESIFCGPNGLIANKITGPSIMMDSITFCLESLNSSNYAINNNPQPVGVGPGPGAAGRIGQLTRSLFALGLTTKLLPQLDSIDEIKFSEAITHIKQSFGNNVYRKIEFNNNTYTISNPSIQERTLISNHFLNEVRSYYRGSMREEIIENMLNHG